MYLWGVGYLEGVVGYQGGRVSEGRVSGGEDNSALGMHPTGMLSCLNLPIV